jgi:cytochrome c peroxidase
MRPGLVLLLLVMLVSAGRMRTTQKAFPEPIGFPPMPLPEGGVTEEAAELGRHLFHDTRLSGDGSLSCASCHRQEAAFSDPPNRTSTGIHGSSGTRNTMPLFNLAWNNDFFWDGRVTTLEEQVLHPVRDSRELAGSWPEITRRLGQQPLYRRLFLAAYGHARIDSNLVTHALGQFLRTLISHRSKYDRVLAGHEYLTTEEYQGFVLMNDLTKGACLHCHSTDADALGTTGGSANTGLDDPADVDGYRDQGRRGTTGRDVDAGSFRIPSLRNVALTAPYMHDGRFATLEEVLDHYSGGVKDGPARDPRLGPPGRGGVRLDAVEKRQIIAFLHTLTDSAFIRDPAFSDPFAAP